VPLDERTDLAGAARQVRGWLSPPTLVRGDGTARALLSFADPAGTLVLSALRAGPDGALIVRVSNPHSEEASGALRFARSIRDSRPLDLREGEVNLGNTGLDVLRTAAPLEITGDTATIRLQPYEIGTWVVSLAPDAARTYDGPRTNVRHVAHKRATAAHE